MVHKITNNDMTAALNAPLAVVDFSATWCGPCKMLAPVLEAVSDEMSEITFFNADVDANLPLAQQNGISSVPALVIFKNGEVVGKSVGFQPKLQLIELLKKYQ